MHVMREAGAGLYADGRMRPGGEVLASPKKGRGVAMKFGIRTPSITRSIRARTTGRITRSIKRSVNPIYGKKGVGWVTNPKKAVYNKVYHKTSIGLFAAIKKLFK
ncbi:MAG: hypothetical protein ACYDH4_02720 [Candidatus Cryosericum sp.]